MAGEIPDALTLSEDAQHFANALGRLYSAQAESPLPAETPELDFAVERAEEAAGKPVSAKSGAGFRTNAEEIKILELYAMELAQSHYKNQGWTVEVLGKPYDLKVTRKEELLHVEVKGTSSDGAAVSLTFNEVKFQNKHFPNNALVVVRNIGLDRSTIPATATGGSLHELRGWQIADIDLRPISYRYTVPESVYAS